MPPSIEGRIRTAGGREYLRVKFRLWPGRGSPIEATLKPELVYALKRLDPDYQDWMIAINYEIEHRATAVARARAGTPKRKKATGAGGSEE